MTLLFTKGWESYIRVGGFDRKKMVWDVHKKFKDALI
jgi:hypothetical protein